MRPTGLRVATRGRTSVLTLARPDRRNELDAASLDALRAALAGADADDGIDVIVLTGEGEHFCGGLDLEQIADPEGGPQLAARVFGDWRIWPPVSKPVIGAINGPAERGGVELALHCDVLVASDRATFADTHTHLGFVPSLGLSVLLARAVGTAMARRMSLSGEPLDAAGALRHGLVTEVVPHDELLPCVLALADRIAANVQPAVRSLLATYRAGADAAAREALALELQALHAMLETSPPGPVTQVVLDVVRRRAAIPPR
jgi:enoyl-CoA hydratase